VTANFLLNLVSSNTTFWNNQESKITLYYCVVSKVNYQNRFVETTQEKFFLLKCIEYEVLQKPKISSKSITSFSTAWSSFNRNTLVFVSCNRCHWVTANFLDHWWWSSFPVPTPSWCLRNFRHTRTFSFCISLSIYISFPLSFSLVLTSLVQASLGLVQFSSSFYFFGYTHTLLSSVRASFHLFYPIGA
jgi:hypothetical protein